MGLLDKVKGAAKDVASGAKKGAAAAKEKVEHVQIRRKADDAAQKLGYLIMRERTKGEPAGAEADSLVAEIVSLEAQLEEEPDEDTAGGTPAT
jgi:hypothetical protein